MKVALIHYWLVNMRGGEKVLEALCELYPQADIFTHVLDRQAISPLIRSRTIHTTFINKLPWAKQRYQWYLPLMPLALEQLDLSAYDLVISSESGPAKGVIVGPNSLHICYCHSPMRYLWDMYGDYLKNASLPVRLLFPLLAHYLRIWDRHTAAGVDHFIANSNFIAKRINKYYRREAVVIHPPVAIEDFFIAEQIEDYYLLFGQLVKYKRADLAIEAFNRLGKPLLVIGEGEMLPQLKRMANDNIRFLGKQPFEQVRHYLAHCKALIFPGVEDFGIVPVEAMASGRPVIAFAAGGAMETVAEHTTGLLFREQTPESLISAIESFEQIQSKFSPESIRGHAKDFGRNTFKRNIKQVIDAQLSDM
ncbi:glycosyltransferase family 4 protein [Methylomonas rivi]|uniref:Glycosyltransferase family 4 protein n=1 Tax=Methylomonas rivi TaxID=2952226 RepID=A0ABT1U8C9_9GAMM|nr:glycosyltransferase family 4 protein [Methylomonas sp. WSC-6]MCQ8130032.1 glycosyltransferase family 4 protein [Methylomonas sp. WSC-6]